jgi:hypothetical protein
MPFLSATPLSDDPEGLAFLRSVLASSRLSCREARAPSWTRARGTSSVRQARVQAAEGGLPAAHPARIAVPVHLAAC